MSDILKALNWRYATKKFDASKKISNEDLNELLEVLMLAPSSFGLQPYKFVVINNHELRSKIKEHAWHQSQITDASHLIAICAKKDVSEEYIKEFVQNTADKRKIPVESLNSYKDMMVNFRKSLTKEQTEDWSKRQSYIALGMLLQTAAMKKIDACPMEGFNPQEVNKILGLDDQGLTTVALCALGHRSSEDSYADYAKVRLSKDKTIKTL
jgi:nitroreductase